ncbi:unnamed protein product [Caretta caretta]
MLICCLPVLAADGSMHIRERVRLHHWIQTSAEEKYGRIWPIDSEGVTGVRRNRGRIQYIPAGKIMGSQKALANGCDYFDMIKALKILSFAFHHVSCKVRAYSTRHEI